MSVPRSARSQPWRGVGWSPPTDLKASGTWPQRHWRALLVLGVTIGLGLPVLIVAVLIGALRFGPNTEARISPVATVVGPTVVVTGTTDLPDGSGVS